MGENLRKAPNRCMTLLETGEVVVEKTTISSDSQKTKRDFGRLK